MSHENFIRVYDNVFSPEHCDDLIKLYEQHIDGGCSQFENAITRKDKSMALLDVPTAMDLAGVTGQSEWVTAFNERLTEALVMYGDEFPMLQEMAFASYTIKIQKTQPAGGYHKWHCEQGGFTVATRMLVWSVYLNDIEDGGETEFLYQSTRIKPKKGSVMFFPASYTHTHRGNPPLKEDKYIVTGWYNLKPE